jgi:hypothetical protein
MQAAAEDPSTGHKASAKTTAQANSTTDTPHLTAAELVNTYRFPLLAAATQQNWDLCQQLLDMGTSDSEDVKQVAAWYAANAGRAQLAVALLKSASAAPPDAGGAGGEWIDAAAAGAKSLGLQVLHDAWGRALSCKDFDSCRVFLEHSPELLRCEETELAAQRDKKQEVVEFLFEACLQKGDCYEQVRSELLHTALRNLAGGDLSKELDQLRALLDTGADVNVGEQGFNVNRPLAFAIDAGYKVSDGVRILMDHGAHVHPDPTWPQPWSALRYAIEHGNTKTCELLLSYERVHVGGAELCAAVKWPPAERLQLLLQAERNLKPSLKASAEERGRLLKKVLTIAVWSSWRHSCKNCYQLMGGPRENRQILEALLAPPVHWHPLPPDLLAVGVRQVLQLIRKRGVSKEMCEVVEVLGKAGADLNAEEGALLMAAATADWYERDEFVRALLRGGLDVRPHGETALRATSDGDVAAELLRAGLPVSSDPALRKRLTELAAEWAL